MVVEVSTIEYNSIYVRHNNSWVYLLYREVGKTQIGCLCAWVHILSDHGNWSYYWGGIGDSSAEAFLADLDSCYLGGKMLGTSFSVHDDEGTQQHIKEHILEHRRDSSLDATDARYEWDLLQSYIAGGIDFDEFVRSSSIDEPWEFSCRKPNDTWTHFWERLWIPCIQPKLKELASAKAIAEKEKQELEEASGGDLLHETGEVRQPV